MITLSPALQGCLLSQSHTLCQLWKIVRQDLVAHRFTSHNRKVVFNGEEYSPVGSFEATALENVAGLETNNRDIRGALVTDFITDEDLRAGVFRDAEIHEWVVDWRLPFLGPIDYDRFFIAEITHDNGVWEATIEGLTSFLRTKRGRLFTRTCNWILGDSRCGFDIESTAVTTAVTAVVRQRLEFGLDEYPPNVANGKVVWLTGNNAGYTSEIRYANPTITLQMFTPYDIEVGDTCRVYEGCDGTKARCKELGNFTNFGGAPDMPTNDKLYRTPDAKT